MLVSGFTIVRNAIKYDYPVVESIKSILPLVDEMVVLIGNSEDETIALIENIGSPKIKIHHSTWDDSLRAEGKVLALETDKAFNLINKEANWAFYIQADEVLHEKFYEPLQNAMQANLRLNEVDGLLFAYKHFFGSYNYVATSRNFYRNEVRIIRNNPNMHAYKDAQGFRKNNNKLQVKVANAEIYHYGWVRHPEMMTKKIKDFHKLWHTDEWIEAQKDLNSNFDYNQIDAVELFTDSAPSVMQQRIEVKNWDFAPNEEVINANNKNKFLYWVERNTGWRIAEYKNYNLIN